MRFRYRQQSIQFKLIAYFIIVAIVLLAVGLVSYFINMRNAEVVSTVLVDYVYLNDLNQDMNRFNKIVKTFLLNKSSDSLLQYYKYSDAIQFSKDKLNHDRSFDPIKMLERNIYYLIEKYVSEADRAVEAKRGRNTENYRLHYENMQKTAGYIATLMDELLSSKLSAGSDQYKHSKQTSNQVNLISLGFTVLSLFIGLILSTRIVLSITRPLIELSRNAEKVKAGNLDIAPLNIQTGDEIQILSQSFDEMIDFIRMHIDDLKLQSELENSLNEQRLQNIQMQSLLKEAELKRLQSQINPHFLYNTLNAGAQLSMIEGADKTSEFMQKIALYFRYMLRQLNSAVTIREELENVESYMYILKTRFGNRIQYMTDIDETLLTEKIPSTILQPIVENAYIHGLEDLEHVGIIEVRLFKAPWGIGLEIKDNGRGMNMKQRIALLSPQTQESELHEHSGIGMNNVIERLKIFYGRTEVHEVIEIASEVNVGTTILLKLYPEGAKHDA